MSIYTLIINKNLLNNLFFTICLVIAVFYFFIFKPKSESSKLEELFISSLKPGDYIVTNGGIHGKLLEINTCTSIIQTLNGCKIKIETSCISTDTTKIRYISRF
jgi:preprotein translocase subunit YajC